MANPKAGHNGIGYRHVESLTVDSKPPYLDPETIKPNANAQWVITDIVNMAQFLESRVSGDGSKYKATDLRECVLHLNKHIVVGGLKKLDGVRTKIADIMAIYRAVTYLKTRSGGSWDDDFGANVITETEEEVWQGIILSRPDCTPFRNQGWPPCSFIEKLDPAKPKGDNSFRPRIGAVGNEAVPPPPHCRPLPIRRARRLGSPRKSGSLLASHSESEYPIDSCTLAAQAPRLGPKTAQDAFTKVTDSLNLFGNQMSSATHDLTEALRQSNNNSSPERRRAALKTVQAEKWLPLGDRLRLGNLVGKGQTADEYLSWAEAGSPERKAWVGMTLGYSEDHYMNA
ncbi:hypothetical protein R3P38DRAFT_3205597 [Favolaschia claudopus]|uniref:Gag protein n=1 Tax=Favolaschia claudopus TaxID=2862362 RepID=A0AAW0ANT6_9AGAR